MDINDKIKHCVVTDEEAEHALEKLLKNYNLQNKVFDRFLYAITQDYYQICEEAYFAGQISEDQKSRIQFSLLKLKRQVIKYCLSECDKNKLNTKLNELIEYYKKFKAVLAPKTRKRITQNINNLHLDLIIKFERLKFESQDLSSIESKHQQLVQEIRKKSPDLVKNNISTKLFEFKRLKKIKNKK